MSPATEGPTTIPVPQASRRALLMGFAAAATPMAPVLANALSEAPAAKVDPIFAAIAEHREAQEALHAACEANGLDMDECPIKQAAEDRADGAELPLFTTAPTTVAGAAALLAYVGSDAHEMNQGPDDNGRPYTVLSYAAGWSADDRIDAVRRFPLHVGAALRNMVGQQTRTVPSAGPDPVFNAIERERSAHADYLVTSAIQRRVSDENPFPAPRTENRRAEKKRLASREHKAWWARYQDVEKAHEASAQRLWAAREAFLQTQPATTAGLLAFLDHIEGPLSTGAVGEAFWDENEKELAVPTLAAAARNLITRGQA
jgi:hypothetical protein